MSWTFLQDILVWKDESEEKKYLTREGEWSF